jgi:phospholipid-binding lipoprotein MlaA
VKDLHRLVRTVALVALVLLGGCASVPDGTAKPQDPFERVNRATYRFNSAIDRAVLKPVATAYRDHVPQFIRTGVSNFLDNLGYPTVIVNDFLQGKFVDGFRDTGRLVLNSTLGLGGLLDPASSVGLARNDEDFGQTLGKWGVPSGPYLVIPLMGPSTLRDTPARYVDAQLSLVELLEDDVEFLDDDGVVAGLVVLNVIDTRAGLLSLDSVIGRAYDEYAFVRDSWMKRREFQVLDGNVPDTEPIEEFPMEEEDEELPPAEPSGAAAAATPPEPADTTQQGDEATSESGEGGSTTPPPDEGATGQEEPANPQLPQDNAAAEQQEPGNPQPPPD